MRYLFRPAAACILLAPLTGQAQTPASGQLRVLPLTQLAEGAPASDLDRRTVSLSFAEPVPVRDLLLQLVNGTSLSIVPDPSVTGTFVGELKNVTVRRTLALVLPPLGLDYRIDGAFVRVFRREPETRLFDVNYIATARTATSTVGGSSAGGSAAAVTATTAGDVFADLANGVRTVLSDRGTFNVDRKAGLLQVTDFAERLERVALYLDTVHERVHRQVQIDVRIVEVELTGKGAQGLDWTLLAGEDALAGAGGRPNVNGIRVADLQRFDAALRAQGQVSLVAAPRVLALNNEPALVRAVSETAHAGARPSARSVTLEVTPQIAGEKAIALSVSPIVAIQDADAGRELAVTSIREADLLARVADGETLVLAGFTRDRQTREQRSGWFGRTTTVNRRVELVIMLTPRIVGPLAGL